MNLKKTLKNKLLNIHVIYSTTNKPYALVTVEPRF